MKTTIQEVDGKMVVALEGEMDTVAAAKVEDMLRPFYTEQDKDVVLDCTGLEYIASSGLRILLSILKGAKASGHDVIMRNVNPDIKNVFKLTGFIDIFTFE